MGRWSSEDETSARKQSKAEVTYDGTALGDKRQTDRREDRKETKRKRR